MEDDIFYVRTQIILFVDFFSIAKANAIFWQISCVFDCFDYDIWPNLINL